MKLPKWMAVALLLAVATHGSLASAGIIPGSVSEIIVESRNGQNNAWYSQAGAWADSGSKSSADGLTGTASTFSSNAFDDRSFTAAPDFGAGGLFEVYVTAAANFNANQPVSVVHAGGTANFDADLSSGVTNAWKLLGTWNFAPGFGGSVTISSNGAGGNVIRGDGFLFAQVVPEPASLALVGLMGLGLGCVRTRR